MIFRLVEQINQILFSSFLLLKFYFLFYFKPIRNFNMDYQIFLKNYNKYLIKFEQRSNLHSKSWKKIVLFSGHSVLLHSILRFQIVATIYFLVRPPSFWEEGKKISHVVFRSTCRTCLLVKVCFIFLFNIDLCTWL